MYALFVLLCRFKGFDKANGVVAVFQRPCSEGKVATRCEVNGARYNNRLPQRIICVYTSGCDSIIFIEFLGTHLQSIVEHGTHRTAALGIVCGLHLVDLVVVVKSHDGGGVLGGGLRPISGGRTNKDIFYDFIKIRRLNYFSYTVCTSTSSLLMEISRFLKKLFCVSNFFRLFSLKN